MTREINHRRTVTNLMRMYRGGPKTTLVHLAIAIEGGGRSLRCQFVIRWS